MVQLDDREFEVPEKLKERYDIKRIAKQGATIEMDGKAVRFDIESKWKNTLENFNRQSKIVGLTDEELKQEIMFYLSEQWLKLLQNGSDGGGGSSSSTTDDDDISAAQRALELAEDQCSELFLDQFGTPYAAIMVGEHVETLPLNSSRFRNWLCKTFYSSEGGRILTSENVTNVLSVLKAKAEFDSGDRKNLYLRVATIPDEPYTIYYDLTNKDWEFIKITPEGWSIIKST
jgi:hypothetical protein